MPLRIRRGTNAERLAITPLEGELIYTTDSRRIYVGDGNTAGGVDIVASTGGSLNGPLDLNTFGLTGVGTIDITGSIEVIGSISSSVELSNGKITFNGNTATSSEGFISPETANTVGILNLGTETEPLQVKKFWAESTEESEQQYGITNGISSLINSKYASRGTLASPLTVGAGDALSYDKVFGYDGFDYVMSSGIWQGVDPYAAVVPGQIPGAMAFVTEGANGQNVVAINSRGFLSVNRFPQAAREALDVNGNGIFSGSVAAGAFIGDVYASDSTLLVNSTTGDINGNIVVASTLNAGTLSINTNKISSSTTFVSAATNTIGVVELDLNTQLKRSWAEVTEPFDVAFGITDGSSSLVTSNNASRGTIASPTVLQPADTIAVHKNFGFDGNDYTISSLIKFDVDPNAGVVPGSVPGMIKFITSNGSSLVEGLTINKDGYVGILSGLSQITEALDVFGNAQIHGKTIFKQDNIGADIFTSYGISSGFTSLISSNYSSRGTLSSPALLNAGDTISGTVNYGYDGSNYVISSLMLFGHDAPSPIAPGIVPGKIQFFTAGISGINPSSGFDSQGYFGIRNAGLPITEALEVNGNAKFIGKTIVKQDGPGFDITTNYGITGGFTSMTNSNYCSRGTVDSPEVLNPGDILSGHVNYGYDGTNYVLSSLILFGQDSNAPITTGNVPGEILFFTAGPMGLNPSSGFDSQGYFGIRNAGLPLTEALDVNGNAKISGVVTALSFNGPIISNDSMVVFDDATGAVQGKTVTSIGYVQFGSYDAAGRAALAPANGMVIYNTTANRFQGFQAGAWINLDDGSAAP